MRLNETKRKQRTSQEEVLAEMFAEAELQDSVRKKKNWDAWMESEVEQQIDEEIRKYLAESSDPTVYLTPKEAKAWNRMPKSKQQRLLQKESQQVFKEWQAGERKAFAGAERRPDDLREDLVFLQSGRIRLGKQRTGMACLLYTSPYGLNTHRLIVTGKRVPYEAKKANSMGEELPSTRELVLTLLPVAFLLLFLMYIWRERRRRTHEAKDDDKI